MPFAAPKDIIISPTYVPDLAHACLDLLLDKEQGIWHLVNEGEITWADFATMALEKSGCTGRLVDVKSLDEMQLIAPRPHYSVLKTEKGIRLPPLENALNRFFSDTMPSHRERYKNVQMQNKSV